MRILFLVPYPTEGASNRIRVEQFLPYLASKGVVCRVRPFINKRFYSIIYLPGHYLGKIFWFVLCTANRIMDIFRALAYDVIFIHREAYPFGAAFIESIIHLMGKPIIFDFDDAIFIPNTSRENIYIERFKNPGKVENIVRMAKEVIVGNDYLKDFALKYNKNVTVIPSSVDTSVYSPAPAGKSGGDIIIGWIGSNTTKEYLYDIEDVFVRLSTKYKNIKIKIVGAEFNSLKLKNIINKKWSLKDEVSDLRSFDIGIMPLPDSEWARGKCGFKAILYMACDIPVVASAVGANLDIIKEGVNGLFAKDQEEWFGKLSKLIEDDKLRSSMGISGREEVIKKYSTAVNEKIFCEKLLEV